MKRRSIETSVVKESTVPYFVRTRPNLVSGTVTLRPIKRRPKTRESPRNSVSLGNLDTIEEWPETNIRTNNINSLRRKKSLSKTISKVSKSLLTYSRTAVNGNLKQPTQVQCLPKIKFNPKLKSGVSTVRGSMRRAIKKISRTTGTKITGENSPKKTPILAQREIIVDNGITIWEEEMTNADDSFDYSYCRNY